MFGLFKMTAIADDSPHSKKFKPKHRISLFFCYKELTKPDAY